MSKVYSFRLDVDNPREAQAVEVIDGWVSQGYSLRYIFTDALIDSGNTQDDSKGLDKFLERLSDLIQELEEGRQSENRMENMTKLPVNFVDAMKKLAGKGIRNGD